MWLGNYPKPPTGSPPLAGSRSYGAGVSYGRTHSDGIPLDGFNVDGKKQNSRRHQKRAVVVDDCPVAFLALKSPMKLFAANPTFDRAGSQLNATWSRSSS